MAVDDVGNPVHPVQGCQRRLAEEAVFGDVIHQADVGVAGGEELLVVNEVIDHAVADIFHDAHVVIAAGLAQIHVELAAIYHLVLILLRNAGVPGQDDTHIAVLLDQLPGQCVHHIAQTTGLDKGMAFRTNKGNASAGCIILRFHGCGLLRLCRLLRDRGRNFFCGFCLNGRGRNLCGLCLNGGGGNLCRLLCCRSRSCNGLGFLHRGCRNFCHRLALRCRRRSCLLGGRLCLFGSRLCLLGGGLGCLGGRFGCLGGGLGCLGGGLGLLGSRLGLLGGGFGLLGSGLSCLGGGLSLLGGRHSLFSSSRLFGGLRFFLCHNNSSFPILCYAEAPELRTAAEVSCRLIGPGMAVGTGTGQS